MNKIFNTSNYKSTGCYSVDLVLNAIGFYRSKNRALKTVILSRYNYMMFDDYFKKKGIKTEEVEYYLDSVLIKEAESSLVDSIRFEFYPEKRTEKLDEIYIK